MGAVLAQGRHSGTNGFSVLTSVSVSPDVVFFKSIRMRTAMRHRVSVTAAGGPDDASESAAGRTLRYAWSVIGHRDNCCQTVLFVSQQHLARNTSFDRNVG